MRMGSRHGPAFPTGRGRGASALMLAAVMLGACAHGSQGSSGPTPGTLPPEPPAADCQVDG